MLKEAKTRTQNLQKRMLYMGIRQAILTDESSIAYLAGFWGYLGIEFGCPTMLVIDTEKPPIVITPLMEAEMVSAMTWVDDVRIWEDTGQQSWGRILKDVLGKSLKEIWVERNHIPAIVRNNLAENHPSIRFRDISPVLGALRVIKTPFEIEIMKQAGEIAQAMMLAAHNSLGEGVPEFESALAVIDAGSRKAAGFLTDKGWCRFVSPMIHNLQIMQSGCETSMVHRRAGV